VLVLDEADQLLSLGFKKELAALLAMLEPTAAARQTLLFRSVHADGGLFIVATQSRLQLAWASPGVGLE